MLFQLRHFLTIQFKTRANFQSRKALTTASRPLCLSGGTNPEPSLWDLWLQGDNPINCPNISKRGSRNMLWRLMKTVLLKTSNITTKMLLSKWPYWNWSNQRELSPKDTLKLLANGISKIICDMYLEYVCYLLFVQNRPILQQHCFARWFISRVSGSEVGTE